MRTIDTIGNRVFIARIESTEMDSRIRDGPSLPTDRSLSRSRLDRRRHNLYIAWLSTRIHSDR